MVEDEELRCYHFGNFYMSSIQQGIQAEHGLGEMVCKYAAPLSPKTGNQKSKLFEWLFNWKTVVLLNGGMNVDLEEIKSLMQNKDNTYPWAYFNEHRDAMDGMLTNVAIVLPAKIFETAASVRKKELRIFNNNVIRDTQFNEYEQVTHCDILFEITDFEIVLIAILNSCSLAR